MNRPRRWSLEFTGFGDDVDMVETPKGNYVLLEDYVALERRHQDLLDAIERTGGLDNIRRVEVSQPVVIDMARENAFMKGENERLRQAGDALYESEIGYYGEQILVDPKHHSGELCRNWNAAKEGKQP